MRDEALYEAHESDETDGGQCPVPEWMLRPLAFALPVIAVLVVLWLVLHR